MIKLSFPFLFFVLFSCSPESHIEQIDPVRSGQEVFATDASGRQYPDLDPYKIYCGPGWGRKFCRFLGKYDGTVWANAGSHIKFSNFNGLGYFISFFNLDSIDSYGAGWKLGETTFDGITWNIKIRIDQEDILWFDYDYYGSSEEIEYSITYKCEVIESVLNFSSTEGHKFIFFPS